MLLVADVFEPFEQERLGCFGPHGVAGAVLQVVDVTPELLQGRHGFARQCGAQAVAVQGFK